MFIKMVNTNEAVLSLATGEELVSHTLTTAINQLSVNPNVWNAFLHLAPDSANSNADMLRELGFVAAGTASLDNKTYLKLVRRLRTSGEAGGSLELAVPAPVLPPSDVELQARALVEERYPSVTAPDLSKVRGAPVPGKPNLPLVSPPKAPQWLVKTNADEIAALQKEIATLEATMPKSKRRKTRRARVQA
jgi:hypothetical protein